MSDDGAAGDDGFGDLLENDPEAGFPEDVEFDILSGSQEEILDDLNDLRNEYAIYQIDYQLTHGRSGAKSYEKKKRELFVAYGPE